MSKNAQSEKSPPCGCCNGSGELRSEIHHGPGWTIAIDRRTAICPVCNGTGKQKEFEGESR